MTSYDVLLQRLVKGYINDSFETTITNILSENAMKEKELGNIIATLCGEDFIAYDKNFYNNLKVSIEKHIGKSPGKIINKVKDCSLECLDINGKTACENSCPFDAIGIDVEHKTSYIIAEKCTDCGFCVGACPMNCLMDKVEFIPLLSIFKENIPVVAVIAPAIAGQLGDAVTLDHLRAALRKVGFIDMFEVAFFADMLTIKEAIEFNKHVKLKEDLLITSCCCPVWMSMLKRIYKELIPHLSPSVSPMIAAGRVLKILKVDCRVVFIGPCIAKKAEAKEKDLLGAIDYVLTFNELLDVFEALSIKPGDQEPDSTTEYASKGGRLYGREAGVSTAVTDVILKLFPEKYKLLTTTYASGIKQCKELLLKIQLKEIDANFIEGMGCVGGCVGGPKALIPATLGRAAVNKSADATDISIPTESEPMDIILKKIHINLLEDFTKEDKTSIFSRNL